MMTDQTLKTQAVKLKGRLYTLTVLQLLSPDLSLIEQQLSEVVALAPKWFDSTPVVLDCSALLGGMFDLAAVCQKMRALGILPIAVQSAQAALQAVAKSLGLASLSASGSQDKPLLIEKETLEVVRTKMMTTPVRSGQQVVSKDGDLLIVAPVSHGAELLADGHIHVYGALRGRALAGISGDRQARIFCHALEAELVSIAGVYCLSDVMKPMSGPCQIYLQDDRIQIEAL